VNSGIGRAQRVLAGMDATDPVDIINAICDERLTFLQSLRTWPTFGRGWARRVADVRRDAITMAKTKSGATVRVAATLSVSANVDLLDPERIFNAAVAHGAPWDKDPQHCHLFYVEGCNLDGKANANAIDKWNDVRGILKFVDGKPKLVFKCAASTEPGIYYDR